MSVGYRAMCMRLQLRQLARNRGDVNVCMRIGGLSSNERSFQLANWGIRRSSSITGVSTGGSTGLSTGLSTGGSPAAKYNLRKLSNEEMSDLQGKIASYGKDPAANSDKQQTGGIGDKGGARPSETASSKEADAILLTDSAIKRLKYLSEKRQKTQYLRLKVDSGGCYGFSYMLDMTEEPEENDVVLDRNGAKVVVDDCSLPLVRGATIDWQDRLIGQAFLVVANPNSSGGCGCGASFEIKID